ncbi:hypothetical protein G6F31_021006 [Rhizopus arrhizus]|nr:hypothetical protein G6F31_021006 [Rhizopus arrhizus]
MLAYLGKANADTEARVRRLIKHAPRCDAAWDALSSIQRDRGELKEAAASLLQAFKLDAGTAHRYVLLSLLLISMQLLNEAEVACLQAISMQQNYGSAHNVLGTRLGT